MSIAMEAHSELIQNVVARETFRVQTILLFSNTIYLGFQFKFLGTGQGGGYYVSRPELFESANCISTTDPLPLEM